jgi:hypothetical protein
MSVGLDFRRGAGRTYDGNAVIVEVGLLVELLLKLSVLERRSKTHM